MKTLPFLENPPKGSRRSRRKHTGAKKKRRPPKGFKSWKTYMASIRPNPAIIITTGGKGMAAKRKHRRRKNAPVRHRRRRNPPKFHLTMKDAPAFILGASIGAVVSTGGIVVARKGRGLAGQMAGTMAGSLIEATIGVAGGLILAGFGLHKIGMSFMQGGLMAPTMTHLNQLQIPHISDAIGDDGVMIGGSSGLGLISAWPDDLQPRQLVGAGGVGRGGSMGLGEVPGTGDHMQDGMGGYVQGMTAAA